MSRFFAGFPHAMATDVSVGFPGAIDIIGTGFSFRGLFFEVSAPLVSAVLQNGRWLLMLHLPRKSLTESAQFSGMNSRAGVIQESVFDAAQAVNGLVRWRIRQESF